MTEPFGPNWAVIILPYIDQQPLYNASNVAATRAGMGRRTPTRRSRTRRIATNYNMNWPTRPCARRGLTCPCAHRREPSSSNPFFTANDFTNYPGARAQLAGRPADAELGAPQLRREHAQTDVDNTVNG